jgi:hypothetical protein
MGHLSIMDKIHGDVELEWDPKDEKSVRKAQREFQNYKKKGWIAYKRVEQKVVKKGEVLKKFDRHAEALIMVPPMAGG